MPQTPLTYEVHFDHERQVTRASGLAPAMHYLASIGLQFSRVEPSCTFEFSLPEVPYLNAELIPFPDHAADVALAVTDRALFTSRREQATYAAVGWHDVSNTAGVSVVDGTRRWALIKHTTQKDQAEIIVHEIGHLLGLRQSSLDDSASQSDHCPKPTCVMYPTRTSTYDTFMRSPLTRPAYQPTYPSSPLPMMTRRRTLVSRSTRATPLALTPFCSDCTIELKDRYADFSRRH